MVQGVRSMILHPWSWQSVKSHIQSWLSQGLTFKGE